MRYYAMVAAGAILWGCWPFFLRPAGLSGAQNALLALLIMALPTPFVLRRESLKDRRATVALVIMGVADAINVALYFAAVKRGPVAIAVLTHYLAPLLVALTVPWVMREPRSVRALIGTPLTLGGLALLIWRPGQDFSGSTAALGAASALFFAAAVFGAKTAARAWSPLAVTAVHSSISVATLLLLFGPSALPPLQVTTLWVVVGGVFSGLLGNLLFNTGLRRIPTTAASALTYLEPLTASVAGWVFFQEALGPWALVGGALVLTVGVWVAAEPRRPVDSLLPSISGSP